MDYTSLILVGIIKLAFAVATPVILYRVMQFTTAHAKQAHLNLSAEQDAQLEVLARKAIMAAEEWAENFAATSGNKVPGAARLDKAIGIVQNQLPNVAFNDILNAINAKLPEVGLGAAVQANAVKP